MALMTVDQRSVIISEEYANLIAEYRNDPRIVNLIPDSIVQIMNEDYAIIYIPVSEFPETTLGAYGYSGTPNLFGLTSEVALEASGVLRLRNIPAVNLLGSGILVGIIDTGINYSLPVFQNTDGTTRIYRIWDQTIQSDQYPLPMLYGTEYTAEQINQALTSADPLSVVPSTDENGHGTILAAVAAGNRVAEEEFSGVASASELVIVKLKQAKNYLREYFIIPPDAACYQEDDIMWGLQYCVTVARQVNRPIAICIGLGSSQGAHDGNSHLGIFTSVMAKFPKLGIVTSAGNEGNMGRHFHGVIDPNVGSVPVELNVAEGEFGFTMELWGAAPGVYSIDILSPSGEYIPRIAASLRVDRDISFIFDITEIHLEYQSVENVTGDQLIMMRFENVSAGTWRFTVYGQTDLTSDFHIWLPMGDFISRETRFIQPDIYTTILDPGTSNDALTVTAYNPLNNTLYVNASRGYTRANVIKPELGAPGVNYIAPDQTGTYATYTGTGIAAAHATGIAALVLEWGVVLGNQPNINTLEIKNYLIRGANRSRMISYPNRDWGFGSINIFNTFNILRIST